MQQAGRERRRTDLYGRARRFAYGLLLLAAAPGAMAADELAAFGQHRAAARPAASASERAVVATLQGLVMVHAERGANPDAPIQDQHGYPRVALDTITARLPEAAEAPLFRVSVSEGRSLRDGVGFDLAVPDIGNFHLNLYARRNARTGGERWALTDAAKQPGQAWSLGGTLELVRTIDGGKHVAFVPELLLDLSDAPARYLPFQASLKLAHWRSLAEKQSLDERVPQLTFKWRL
jgi:hypothetical protein